MENIDLLLGNKDIQQRFEKVAATGYVLADLSQNTFVLSDFARHILGTEEHEIDTDRLVELVTPEDRERIRTGLAILSSYGIFDSNFRIEKEGAKVNVRMKFDGIEYNTPGNHRVSYGFIRLLTRHADSPSSWEIINSQFRELEYWQTSVPQSLMMMLDNKSYTEVVSEMLRSLIERFGADKACFFEFDWKAGTQTCLCELLQDGVRTESEHPAEMSAGHFPWLNKQFNNRKAAVVNNIDDLPEEAATERATFAAQGIRSVMVVPMFNQQGVWGHIGLAYIGREHHWTGIETGWFTAISNLASICLELHYSNKEVRRERQHLRYLQKNMPVGLEVYDREGLLIDENNAALRLIGFKSREEMLAMKINLFENTFIPREKRDALRRGETIRCDIYLEETPFSKPFFSNADSDHKYLNLTASALLDDKQQVINYLTILTDHTEMQSAYLRLQEFENMFCMISEFSEIGFVLADILNPGQGFYATDQWLRNLNITREHLLTASGIVPDTIHPKDAAKLGEFLDNAIHDTSARQQEVEIRVRNSDGTTRWLRWCIMVVERDPAANKVRVFGVNLDITAMKEVESALTEAKNFAEESDKLKSDFLSNMSHEIRTPLNAVVGFSTMLAEANDRSDLNEYASIIAKNNKLLLDMFSDVIELSKLEAGIVDIEFAETNAKRICAEVIQIHSYKLQPGVELRFDPSLPDHNFVCDRMRVMQVLGNLLSNAMKFTAKGFIELSYAIEEAGTDSYIEFRVRDTGKGMTPEQAAMCFERFNKADNFMQGLGLGLYISKMLANRLGGRILVESRPDEGSCFRLQLPVLASARNKQLDEYLRVSTRDGRQPVILVAEDMKINYMLISKLLGTYYKIIIAENGEDAVRLHEECSPDLILMDLKMPRMDGLQATRIIRSKDTATPIVAITAFAFDFDRRKALDAGCNYMITKPIDPTQICKIIRKFILDGKYEPKTKRR